MFWETFLKLCSEKGVKPTPVILELNISRGSVTNWKKGAIPQDSTLQKIADYFGVSVNELLGKEPACHQAENISPEMENLLYRIKGLDKTQLSELSDYVDFLLTKKKSKV